MPHHPTALLIIRAWVEDGSAVPLRANVRATGDVSLGIERSLTLVEPDAVREAVESWLQAVLEASDADTETNRARTADGN